MQFRALTYLDNLALNIIPQCTESQTLACCDASQVCYLVSLYRLQIWLTLSIDGSYRCWLRADSNQCWVVDERAGEYVWLCSTFVMHHSWFHYLMDCLVWYIKSVYERVAKNSILTHIHELEYITLS